MNVATQPKFHNAEWLSKPRKRYNDKEALDVLTSKAGSETRAKDVVHNSLERLWFRCIARYAGAMSGSLDAVFASPDSAILVDDASPSYQANHLAPFVLRQVARLSSSVGRFEVWPRSTDFRDQRAAKVGRHLLDYWHDRLQIKQKRRELAFWQTLCGNGCLYTHWDSKAGTRRKRYRDPMDPSRVLLEEEIPEGQRAFYEALGAVDEEAEGDIEAMVLGPFQVYLPSSYSDIQQAPWVVIEHMRSMEWLWERYPEQAKQVTPEDFQTSRQSLWWRKLAGIVKDRGAVIPGAASFHDEAVIVREFIRPPSRLVKEGARILACQSQLLVNEPHPMVTSKDDARFPIAHARYSFVPGRLWAMGMVEHLLDPQDEYDRGRSQVMQHRDVLSHPQWTAKRGTKLSSTRVNIGDLWEWEGSAPVLVNPPALSPAHMVTIEQAMNDMRLIASQTEVSQGQTPPGVKSGVAIRALQERDLETVGSAYEEHESCMQSVCSRLLVLSAAHMSVPRAVHVYGKDRATDVKYFSGKDLRGNTKVVVAPGSMAPRSKAMVQQNVFDLIQVGGLDPTDPDQKRLIFDAMEIGELSNAFTLSDLNRRRAEIENDMLIEPELDELTGKQLPPPDVHDFDDHVIHIERHMALCLSDAFEQAEPALQMMVLAHVQKHKHFLAQLAMLQARMAQTQGAQGSEPKETGTPSPPKRQTPATA